MLKKENDTYRQDIKAQDDGMNRKITLKNQESSLMNTIGNSLVESMN